MSRLAGARGRTPDQAWYAGEIVRVEGRVEETLDAVTLAVERAKTLAWEERAGGRKKRLTPDRASREIATGAVVQ